MKKGGQIWAEPIDDDRIWENQTSLLIHSIEQLILARV
jgi:hypothetical protein